jgi:hypothetical protein
MTDELISKLLYQIIADTERKKMDYYKKYHHEASYIKIPLWLYETLIKYHAEMIDIPATKLCGLEICATVSIEQISEIEVF